MGAKQRALATLAAKESFGFRRSVVKSALKDNDNNWDYVETINYNVLVDCILSRPSDKARHTRQSDEALLPVARVKVKLENDDETCRDGPSNGIAREDVGVNQAAAGWLCVVDVASSALGEVKISLECNDRPGFRMPSMEVLFREVENICLRTYKIIEPSFSLANVMKEMCQCALEMGSDSNGHRENIVNVILMLDSKKTFGLRSMPGISSNGLLDLLLPECRRIKKEVIVKIDELQGHAVTNEHQEAANEVQEAANGSQKAENGVSNSLLVVHPALLPDIVVRPSHDFTDISRGEERYMIRVAYLLGNGRLLPHFYYIPNNIVYQNAKVNFSLARIGDEDCCLDCFGAV